MEFRNVEWIALIPVLALAGWVWPRLGLRKPLRVVILLLLTFLLMQPRWRTKSGGLDLWVLLDRSASTEARIDAGLPEWQDLLERNRRSKEDRIRLVDYAVDTVPQETNAGQPFTGSRALTRTGLAVQNILALRDEDRASRILLFTDGYSTEPLTGVADKLIAANLPLDVRLLTDPGGTDLRVRALRMPVRVQVAEPFLLEVEVAGPGEGKVPLVVERDGQTLLESEVEMHLGRGVARFTDRIPVTGAFRYEAAILPKEDAHPGNNRASAWVEVSGGPRLLLVTGYVDDPLAAVLRQQGFTVEVADNPRALQPGQLTGCRGVILNNVPAWSLPADFMGSLDFFVTGQGGGLLMAGGKKSFGSGGYFQSPVDALLPVSMELKKDQRKLAAAMAIVMDRSGSMGASAGGGTKMDLANEGAARAIELLGAMDSVAVFAVDSEAHEMVSMQQIGDEGNRQNMIRKTRRIVSQGGGIFVYNGLKAGWKALKTTDYGTRHIILFADAADAEQPEDYVKLLAEVTAEGGTVSVIAMGSPGDSDAAFLEDVAKRGNGRLFYAANATDIPNVFTAETVAVARSAFVSDPVPTLASGQWHEVSGKPFAWLGEVDGYNLSYRREWASQGLVSKDEFTAPLVAWGQRGIGRTAAVSFPLGGEYSERIRGWEQYGDFAQTLCRWLMGEDLPPGLGLRPDIKGTELSLDLLYSDDWEEKFATQPPRILLAEGERPGKPRELTWERMEPGRYRVTADLEEGTVVRGAVQVGAFALPFGPVTLGTNAEWAFDPARVEEVRQLAVQSGGRMLANIKEAWQSPPVDELRDLRGWLLPLLLALVLAEALLTRMGWQRPDLDFSRLRRKASGPVPARTSPAGKPVPAPAAVATPAAVSPPPPTPGPTTPAPPAAPTAAEAADAAARRRERFARAKKTP